MIPAIEIDLSQNNGECSRLASISLAQASYQVMDKENCHVTSNQERAGKMGSKSKGKKNVGSTTIRNRSKLSKHEYYQVPA